MKKYLQVLIICFAVVYAQLSFAQIVKVSNAAVQKVLIDSQNFGGCMVAINKTLANSNLNCPGNWVALSCSGDFAPKDLAFRMLDQAQIALALKKNVNLYVNDSKKHNGYCFATRIDILN